MQAFGQEFYFLHCNKHRKFGLGLSMKINIFSSFIFSVILIYFEIISKYEFL